jgi:hypothetical protein
LINIKVKINNQVIVSIIDSGATSSVINEKLVKELNLKFTPINNHYCVNANNEKVMINGITSLTFNSSHINKKFVINTNVFKESSNDLILGNDFGAALKLVYDLSERKVYSLISGNLLDNSRNLIELKDEEICFSSPTSVTTVSNDSAIANDCESNPAFIAKRQEILNSVNAIKQIEKKFSTLPNRTLSSKARKTHKTDQQFANVLSSLTGETKPTTSNTDSRLPEETSLQISSNKVKICLYSDRLLAPKATTLVPINIINAKPNQLYVTNTNPGLLLQSNIALLQACIDSNVSQIALTNFSDKPVVLKNKTTLCRLTEVIDETNKEHINQNKVNENNSIVHNLITTLAIITNNPSEHFQEIVNGRGNIQRMPILSEEEFKINTKLKNSDRLKVLKVIREFDDVFAHHPYDLGCSSIGQMKLELTEEKIIARAPYKTSIKERDQIWGHISELLKAGVIKRSLSPYASPVLLVNKHDSEGHVTGTRMVVDFRMINKITKPISYPLPLISDALACLSGQHYFTSLDSIQGYHQMVMHKDSRKYCAFTTPFGNFEPIRVMFGLRNAVQVFMHMMNILVGSLQFHELLLYLDDIITWSQDIDSHLVKLRKIFTLFRSANLKLKPSKCYFLMEEINFLGHLISKDGIKPIKTKIDAICQIPVPKTRKALQRFLGAANFYAKFIKSYAQLAAPLYALIKGTETMHKWTGECDKNFNEIKNRLKEQPVLQHYNNTKTVYLRTDCSDTAIGLVLLQEDDNKILHPIAYHSKALKSHQKSMGVSAKEYLAIVYGTRLYRNYLLDKKFIVITDHIALRKAKGFKPENRQLTRFDLELSEFDFDIKYVPAKQVADADMLSRIELENEIETKTDIEIPAGQFNNYSTVQQIRINSTEKLPEDIISAQNKDKFCKTIINILSAKRKTKVHQFLKTSKKFILIKDKLYRKIGNGSNMKYNLVIPYSLQEWLLHNFHRNINSHLGEDKTIKRIRESYWFQNMDILIRAYVKSCNICGQIKHRNTKIYDIPKSLPHEQIPYYHVYCDFVGPLEQSLKGNQYIIICVDAATRHLTAFPTRNETTAAVIKFFREEIIPKYGLFSIITTDNGPCFKSKLFKEFSTKLNIKHNNCTEYTPTANAISERYVQTLINCIKSYCSMVSKDWEKHLRNCVFSINNSVHEVMNYSPIFLLMGYKPRSFIENQFDVKEYLNSESSTDQLMYSWITARQEAHENLLKYQNKSKENYAIKCRLPPFALGSLVWLEDQTPAPQGLRSKLRRKFIGPFCIVKLTSDKTYWLVNSTKVSSIRDFKRADAKKLKHYSGKDKKIAKRHQKLLKLINENYYEKVKDIKDLPKH